MTTILLDAGDRQIRGVARSCRLLVTKEGDARMQIVLAPQPAPTNLPTFTISFKAFKDLMRRNGLDFRRRHESKEAMKEAMERSLRKYRQGAKYRSLRLLRSARGNDALTADARHEIIRTSDISWTALAQKYRISLREVRAIKESDETAKSDPADRDRDRLLVGHGPLGAAAECGTHVVAGGDDGADRTGGDSSA